MNEKNQERLKKYTRLVLEQGLAMYPGKSILIRCEPAGYEKAEIFAETAYELGAKHVAFELRDLKLLALRTHVQKEEYLTSFPSYLTALDYERISEDWGYLAIDTTETRAIGRTGDPEKSTLYSRAAGQRGKTVGEFNRRHRLSWCVIAVPGPVWAKEVLGAAASEDDMWDLVAPILMLDEENPSEAWRKKGEEMLARRAFLDSLKIKSLHYTSPVTDFKVGFRENAIWKGGYQVLPDGKRYFPNLPTAETYSAPDYETAEGYITSTRPVTVMNKLTDKVTFTFEKGKVVDVKAEVGEDIIRKYISVDEGTSRIGEVALVDENSPIAKSKKIFGSILYDENASCHIALGSAYPDCLRNGNTLSSDEELHAAGLNTSIMHTDFMVGSRETDIVAETYDGKTVQIMKKGLFTI